MDSYFLVITAGFLQNKKKKGAINPKDVQAYLERGISYAEQGKLERALKDFERVISLDPNDAKTYLFRGIIYSNLGNLRAARADLKKAHQLSTERGNIEIAEKAASEFRKIE